MIPANAVAGPDAGPAKPCKKCGEVKPLTAFYATPRTRDGRLGECQECTKGRVAANRDNNPEHYRQYDLGRREDPDRREAGRRQAAAYKATPEGKAKHEQGVKRWQERHPEKRRAQMMVHNELKQGRMTRPKACPACGEAKKIQAHHEDYSQPLLIEWLCASCHGARHRRFDPR